MDATDFQALLPLLALCGAIVAVMGAIAVRRSHAAAAALAILGLAAAFGSIFVARPAAPRLIGALLIIDDYALLYFGLLIAASIFVAMLSYRYLEGRGGRCEEFYLLLLLATLGTCVLAAGTHFAAFFLGLEILTVSLYAMIAYFRTGERSIEAGLKYLILAAVSSAFLLFGMALVYARTGAMTFEGLAAAALEPGSRSAAVVLAGLALMTVGIGFKLALVPFHMWTPDVYEGAPAPVAAYVATASKGAVAAILIRLAVSIDGAAYEPVFCFFAGLAILSMAIGNVAALVQDNVKRILAYSSIAHLGYVLVAFLAGGPNGAAAVAYYFAAYFPTTLGAFGVITVLSGPDRDADHLDDFRGLGRERPLLAAVFAVMLLSLAGIPLTGGFVGKYFVIIAGVDAASWTLVLMLVAGTLVGVYYYLRIVAVMYMQPRREAAAGGSASPAAAAGVGPPVAAAGGRSSSAAAASDRAATKPLGGGLILGSLTLAVLWLGLWPGPLMQLIRAAMSGLFQ